MEQKELFDLVMDSIKPWARDDKAVYAATKDSRIVDDLRVEPVNRIKITMQLESRLGIQFTANEAYDLQTVGELMMMVEEKVAAKRA